MAKYSVTFACGHTEERQLVGKETRRQAYIAWAGKSGQCSACTKLDKMAAIEAVEAEHDLPALTGSEKQVAWARKIRAERFGEIAAYIAQEIERAKAVDKVAEVEARAAVLMQVAGSDATARYWIDNKDKSGKALIQAAHAATRQ